MSHRHYLPEPGSKLEPHQFGFIWGPATVTRLTSHRGAVVIGVAGSKRRAEIYVSPTGRSVRVFVDGVEFKPA